MNGKNPLADPQFVEQELFDTKRALFSATTVKEMKFLQSKLNFLTQKAKEINKGEIGGRGKNAAKR